MIGKAKKRLEKKQTGETTKVKKALVQKEKKTDKLARKRKPRTPAAIPKKDALTWRAAAVKKPASPGLKLLVRKVKVGGLNFFILHLNLKLNINDITFHQMFLISSYYSFQRLTDPPPTETPPTAMPPTATPPDLENPYYHRPHSMN